MQYEIKFQCTDEIGTFESNWCNFFDCDSSAIEWAKEEFAYFRERWNDLHLHDCILVESFLDKIEDRFICEIS